MCPERSGSFPGTLNSRFLRLFRGLKHEQILKVTLAASKIGISRLVDMSCFYIADLCSDLTKENFKLELGLSCSAGFADIEEWAELQYSWLQNDTLKLPVDND